MSEEMTLINCPATPASAAPLDSPAHLRLPADLRLTPVLELAATRRVIAMTPSSSETNGSNT
jgi:hypothetical protein